MPKSSRRPPLESLFAAVRLPHFPAQALAAQNPDLRGQPFAVVEQHAENHKTPLLAVSQAGRALGVEAGLPAFLVARRWRNFLFLPRDLAAEAATRASVKERLYSLTPEFSLRPDGSALLDMTGTPSSREAPPVQWPQSLRQGLIALYLEEVSVGVGASQVAAQVAARLPSARGIRVCEPGTETAFLNPLSPDLLPGLSPGARARLRQYGLLTVEQVGRLDREELRLRFGGEAEKLYCLVRGLDLQAVSFRRIPLIAETVLARDVNDAEALRGQVRLTADKLGHALRQNQSRAARITLALQYSDGRSLRRSTVLHPPTAAFLKLAETAEALFAALHQRRVALRRIRLEVSLPMRESGQTDLFDADAVHKQEALAQALDRIRRKQGFGAVLRAGSPEKGLRSAPAAKPRRLRENRSPPHAVTP